MEAWVAFTDQSDTAAGPIVTKTTGNGGYFLIRELGKLRWQAVNTPNGASIFGLWSPTNINDGLWHHVVGTYSTTTGLAALYIDAQLVASTTGLSTPIPATTQAFLIGGWGNNGDTFKGSIDEVAV